MVWTQDYTIVLCGLYAFPVCVLERAHCKQRWCFSNQSVVFDLITTP